jgi:pimeloyl-ACP methyl ester carboxylesterase
MTGEAAMRTDERMIHANGVDLCVETFGDPSDPTVLLIMGAAGSMDLWEDEFCERIAAGGRYVIRYDHRDTGRSASSEPGKPTYTFADLVDDAAGVLDALGRPLAHVVGVSMGGAIAQTLVFGHPDRVRSLTLISTSAADDRERELPSMSDGLRDHFASPSPAPDWSDRTAVVDYLVAGERPFLGPVQADDATKRALAGRVFDRTTNVAASQTNHWILDGGDPVAGQVADIAVPTLVVHGTADPLFPIEHGEALAAEIPGARLIQLDGVGHEVPPPAVWDRLVPAIVEHTAMDHHREETR